MQKFTSFSCFPGLSLGLPHGSCGLSSSASRPLAASAGAVSGHFIPAEQASDRAATAGDAAANESSTSDSCGVSDVRSLQEKP